VDREQWWAASGRGTVVCGGRSTKPLDVIVSVAVMAIIAALVGLNAFATAVVARSSPYEPRQKLLQYGFIWLVPLIGGVLSWSLAREEKARRLTTDLTDSSAPDDGDLRLSDSARIDWSHTADHSSAGESGDSGGGDGH